jgi:hypothetical protein
LKEEALDRTIWRARFGRGFGPVVKQTTQWMSECRLTFKIISSYDLDQNMGMINYIIIHNYLSRYFRLSLKKEFVTHFICTEQ